MTKKNYSLYGLPEEIKFCKKCVISNQRPSSTVEFKSKDNQKQGINFDANGICDACNYHEIKNNIDWEEREKKLIKLCDKYRKNKGYDCIVPGSGGKDSAYASHLLKYKYGMNPLTVTWAPHLYTDIGWKNFINWIHVGGFDNFLCTPNGKLHRLLTKLAFENLLHPFQPFFIGQKIIGPLMALKFDIPLIFYGENQAEYGNSIEENETPKMDRRFFSINDPSDIYLGGISISEIISKYNYRLNEFYPYIPPSIKEIENAKIEQQFLGYYIKWDPQECYYFATENTGFNANTERTEGTYSKYVSLDDKIDSFIFILIL